MITVHLLSPQNEVRIAERLAEEIRAAWPEVANHATDRIALLVGIRSGTDVDLLIVIDFEHPRPLPVKKRVGVPVPEFCSGLIVVEVKQLDPECFERIGNQFYSVYAGARSKRSCVDQARDGSIGIQNIAASSGLKNLFVHSIAWLTEVPTDQLRDADASLVGREVGFREIFAAAYAQNHSLGYESDQTRSGVRAVRARLLNRPVLTALDRIKTDKISRSAVVNEFISELAPRAGKVAIRLAGHGGSGKTTALILLAIRLALLHGGRVLFLTYHHALCGDIRHVIAGIPDASGISPSQLHVETATDFLLGIVEATGTSAPLDALGAVDYTKLDALYPDVTAFLSDPDTADGLKAIDPERLAWDHVLIDESQDWSDAERDLVLAAYGHKRLVLADGLAQLVNRQTSCNWLQHVPRAEHEYHILGDSLRMQRNVATFANAFAAAAGFADWRVKPRADLTGGRIVVIEGALEDPASLVKSIGRIAAAGKAKPLDNLICVPPTFIQGSADNRASSIATALEAEGEPVWDACNRITRTLPSTDENAWRIIQYASCRGLEGWATVLFAIDDLYANKLKYPSSSDADGDIDAELVARRWLLIPLTRAVHLLVVHVRDPESPVGSLLREATSALPKGVVEWYSAGGVAASLH
jgi:hypothetical protein